VNAIPGNLAIGDNSGNDKLQLLADEQIANTSDVKFNTYQSSTATLDLNGHSETVARLNDSSGNLAGALITNTAASTTSTFTVGTSANDTYWGIIADGAGKVGLTKQGTGSLELANVNTYTGATNVLAGTLLLYDRTSTDAALTGVNAISSSPEINVHSGGTLDVSNLPGAYHFTSAQTLAGAGTIVGSSQIEGTVSPGDNGTGTLSITSSAVPAVAGSLTLASGAVYDYDIDGTTALPLTDLIALTSADGVLTLGGSYTLNVSDLSAGALDPTGKTFTLISYLGTDPESVGTWAINLPAGWEGTPVVSLDTANKAVVLSGITGAPVPEPATTSLICLGAAGLLLRRARPRVA